MKISLYSLLFVSILATTSCKHSQSTNELLVDKNIEQKAQPAFMKMCTDNSNLDLMYALLDNDGDYHWALDSFRGIPEGFYETIKPESVSPDTLTRFRDILISAGDKLTANDCQKLTQHMNSLRHLEVILSRRYNDDSDAGLAEEFQVDLGVLAQFKNINSLRVFGGNVGHVRSYDFLKQLPNLQYLSIATSTRKHPLGITNQFDQGFSNLRFLKLADVQIENFNGFNAMPKLEQLVINASNIGQLAGLEKFPNMQELKLYEVGNHQDFYKEQSKTPFKSLAPINKLPKLKKLSLIAVGLSNQLFAELQPNALPQLEMISVERNAYFTDKDSFAKLKSLKNFDINESGLEFENQTEFWSYVEQEFPHLKDVAKTNLASLNAMNKL